MTKPKHWTARLGAKTPAERHTLEKLTDATRPKTLRDPREVVEAVAQSMYAASCQRDLAVAKSWSALRPVTRRDWHAIARAGINTWRERMFAKLMMKAQRTRTGKRER